MRSPRTDTGLMWIFGVLTLVALLMLAGAAIMLLRQGAESDAPGEAALISDGTYTPLAASTVTAGTTGTPGEATSLTPITDEPSEAAPTETLRPTPTQFFPFPTSGIGRAPDSTQGAPAASQGAPASTQPAPASTRAATSAPAATQAATNSPDSTTATETVTIYMIALGNDGASGSAAGCGDSLIPVRRVIAAQADTPARITAALNALFAVHDQTLDNGGLYNALYQSSLAVAGVTMEGDTAVVALTGSIVPGDDCDKSRIEAQIETTIGQVWEVQSVRVTVNGVALEEVLYGGG